MGFVASITGIAAEDQVLTASASVASDADGLASSVVYSYQWQSSSDGVTWTNVPSATNVNYVLGDADVGN